MSDIRAKAGIKCYKFISKFYIDKLVVLRNHNEIFDGTYRDIDLVLIRNDSSLDDILKNKEIYDKDHFFIGYLKRKNFLQLKVYSKISKEVFIIDIWDSLEWKGIPYFLNKKKISELTINTQDEIHFFDSKVQLMLATCKCITQTGQIKEKYKNELNFNNLSSEMVSFFGFDYMKLYKASKIKRFSILLIFTKGIYINQFFIWMYKLFIYYLQKKGTFIELIGPDGSGKTSLSKLLVEEKLFYSSSLYFHGRIPILPRISSLLKFKRAPIERSIPDSEIQLKHTQQNSSNRKFTLAHIVYYSIDSLLSRVKLYYLLKKDVIVVVDRSPYDIYARRDYSRINDLLKKFYVFCHPNPCIRLLLKADPSTINQRKNELTISEINYQYGKYETYLRGKNYKKIDTGSGLDVAFEHAIKSYIQK